MSLWTMIFLLAIAGMIYSAWRSKHLAQHGVFEDQGGEVRQVGGGAREAALERELDELRKRVAVLERIATEDPAGRRLSAEIDALRDSRKLEEGSKQ